jgi:hypothetical protein
MAYALLVKTLVSYVPFLVELVRDRRRREAALAVQS